jgi:hypothetical protein
MSFTGTPQPWPSPLFKGAPASALNPNPSFDALPQQGYGPSEDTFEGSNTAPSTPPAQPATWQSNAKGFIGGLFSPITGLFKSPTSFLLNAGTFVFHALLIGATRGAVAPLFVAMGSALGLYQLAKGAHTMATGQTGDDRKHAWFDLGAGLINLSLLFLGGRTALKEAMEGGIKLAAGKSPDSLSLGQALLEHFRQLPTSLRISLKELRSGNVVENTGKSLQRQSKELSSEFRGRWDETRAMASRGKGQVPTFEGIMKVLRSFSLSTWFIH